MVGTHIESFIGLWFAPSNHRPGEVILGKNKNSEETGNRMKLCVLLSGTILNEFISRSKGGTILTSQGHCTRVVARLNT